MSAFRFGKDTMRYVPYARWIFAFFRRRERLLASALTLPLRTLRHVLRTHGAETLEYPSVRKDSFCLVE